MNNFALLDAEDNTSRPLNRGSVADLPLLRTLKNLPKVTWAKFLGSDRLFYFLLFYLLYGSSTANFGPLSRGQLPSPDINLSISFHFDQHVTESLFCFISISKFISIIKNPFVKIPSLSELHLRSRSLCCWYKWKKWFLDLWLQQEQLKIMEMNEAWPNISDEEYIHQFRSRPTYKIQ